MKTIAVVCVAYSLYAYSKLIANIICGYTELKKIKASPYTGIKCENLSFKLKNYLINIVADIVLVYCFIKLYNWTETVGMTWGVWIYRLLILIQILSILTHIIVAFYDEYAYLTPSGLVHITGVMKPSESRYVWEEQEEGVSSNLLVYRAKSEIPIRFKVLDRLDVAHEVVKGYKESKPN